MTPFQAKLLVLIVSVFAGLTTISNEVSSVQRMKFGVSLRISEADTVRAGQTYITNLPDSVSGIPVLRYRGIALPPKSWLINQSFFWRTDVMDRGLHELWFRAYLTDSSVDSLSLLIAVE